MDFFEMSSDEGLGNEFNLDFTYIFNYVENKSLREYSSF